ncbi:MAG: DUF5054 domain-containing protein [Tannerella sp.]|jgi:hypothetical protein|nr:DUF5054 domain-containing protein [Tannerella sp.]
MSKRFNLLLFFALLMAGHSGARQASIPDNTVEKVHVIFKTHLDVGFTDLPSKVEQKYINEFIPKALDVAEKLRAEGGTERYVWTTGSWLIDAYLRSAEPEAVSRLDAAIRRGDIFWNGVPYTFESEAASRDLFETTLKLAARLDARYGKKTIAAKMTDVPGHTRSIITSLSDAGIRFLHIGVNPASAVPQIPAVCRWQNIDGKEVILMYQGAYGTDMTLPDGKTVVSINFTSDNHGPHTVEQVKSIYASMRQRYPKAELVASSLNAVAEDVLKIASDLPVLTSEIGDTWIYGYASAPVMMAQFRALQRLYSQWIKDKKIDPDSDLAIDYTVHLGLVAEHTWGVDVKTFIKNWDKYDVDAFNASRNLPEILFGEQSWDEKAERIEQSIALLPPNLQREANAAIASTGKASKSNISRDSKIQRIDNEGAYKLSLNGNNLTVGRITYQTFSNDDYLAYRKAYIRGEHEWALGDFGKPGLENSKASNTVLTSQKGKSSASGQTAEVIYSFPSNAKIDKRVLPEEINARYDFATDGMSVEMTVSVVGKPAVRLPEAWWVSFVPDDVTAIFAEKTGMSVDVSDVVKGGNRQMHGIDNYIDINTSAGTIRITSLDAPVVAIGKPWALDYSENLPDLKGGVHFCLFNNLWGTNFRMWWGGDMTYRFKIELLKQEPAPKPLYQDPVYDGAADPVVVWNRNEKKWL